MKALILTLGTRGDVQPFVALAQGLTDAGHEAVLAAPHRFAGFVRERGITFAGIDDGPMRLMDHGTGSGTVVDAVATGGLRAKLALAKRMPAMFTTVLEDCWSVATERPGAGADVLVHNGQVLAGQHVAERLAIPAVLALPIPLYVPTREFPWPGAAAPTWLPPAYNRATYLGMKGPAVLFARTVDRWRDTTLGLPRRPGRHDPSHRPDGAPAPVLHAISRHVLPRPTDWPPTATMTGYWFTTHPEQPGLPDALTRFLDAGEPPVFVGFGSMAGSDPAATTTTVLDAAQRAGARVVLGTGWGGLAATASDHVHVIDDVPYEHLFPHVAAIVHHGGAGTTAAAAAAGRPQVVCPFVADQPFWGRRLRDLGAATGPIHQRHLSADRLAQAIHTAVTDAGLADAAADLGTRIRAERGIDNAVRQLENVTATGS